MMEFMSDEVYERWAQNRKHLPEATKAVLQELVVGTLSPNWHRGLLVPNWFNREHLTHLAGREVSEEEMSDFTMWAMDGMAEEVKGIVKEWLASYFENERDERLGEP